MRILDPRPMMMIFIRIVSLLMYPNTPIQIIIYNSLSILVIWAINYSLRGMHIHRVGDRMLEGTPSNTAAMAPVSGC